MRSSEPLSIRNVGDLWRRRNKEYDLVSTVEYRNAPGGGFYFFNFMDDASISVRGNLQFHLRRIV